MIVLDVEQGSQAWHEARIGHPHGLAVLTHRHAGRQAVNGP